MQCDTSRVRLRLGAARQLTPILKPPCCANTAGHACSNGQLRTLSTTDQHTNSGQACLCRRGYRKLSFERHGRFCEPARLPWEVSKTHNPYWATHTRPEPSPRLLSSCKLISPCKQRCLQRQHMAEGSFVWATLCLVLRGLQSITTLHWGPPQALTSTCSACKQGPQ